MRKFGMGVGLLAAAYLATPASAAIVISEWAYDGSEFIEFTNTGTSAVSLNGWSFDDNTRVAGSLSLSSLGSVAAGEAFVISQDPAATFRTLWGLPESAKVLQNNAADVLQRSDEINLYNDLNVSVDRLTYNDQAAAGDATKSPRTQNTSGNLPTSSYGLNTASAAVLSAVGDGYGSFAAPGNAAYIGSPTNTPEPTGLALVAAAGLVGLRRRRTV